MATLSRELRAGGAVLVRNLHMIRRYASWELVFFFYSVINVLTIGLIAYAEPASRRGPEVLYLAIGALLWGFLSLLFQEVANAITYERWEGTIEYSFMAPIRRISYLAGNVGGALLYSLVRSALALVAVALFFHLRAPHVNAVGAMAVMLVSAVPFVGLGLVMTVLPLLSTERGAQATQVIQGLMLLVSGVYYPVSVLPVWLRWLSGLSPATYTLEAERMAILHGAGWSVLAPDLVRLAVTGVVLVPLGLVVFHEAERYALRTGRLKRNG